MNLYSDYRNAKTEYNTAIEHLSKIKPSRAVSTQTRIQENRRAISDLRQDTAKIEKSVQIINTVSENSKILPIWNNYFPLANQPKTDDINTKLKKEITKDELELADEIMQDLFAKPQYNPDPDEVLQKPKVPEASKEVPEASKEFLKSEINYTTLLDKIQTLTENHEDFKFQKDKLLDLNQQVKGLESKNLSDRIVAAKEILKNFQLEKPKKENPTENDQTPAKEFKDKMTVVMYQVQNKLLKDVTSILEVATERQQQYADIFAEKPIEEAIPQKPVSETDLKQEPLSEADNIINTLISDIANDNSELVKTLNEKKGEDISDLKKLIDCAKLVVDQKKETKKLPEKLLVGIDEKLATHIDAELREIDSENIPTIPVDVVQTYQNKSLKEKEREADPGISFVLGKIKNLKEYITKSFGIYKKDKDIPTPVEAEMSSENRLKFAYGRDSNRLFDRLVNWDVEMDDRKNNITTVDFLMAKRKEFTQKINYRNLIKDYDLYPNCPMPITKKMEENIRTLVGFYTWSALTDAEKLGLLTAANQPTKELAAQKIDDVIERIIRERAKTDLENAKKV